MGDPRRGIEQELDELLQALLCPSGPGRIRLVSPAEAKILASRIQTLRTELNRLSRSVAETRPELVPALAHVRARLDVLHTIAERLKRVAPDGESRKLCDGDQP